MYWLPQNALRMHHFDAISQKISGGGPPYPHLREGMTPSPTLPLSALRASVKPSASLVTCAPPAVEVLDPPLWLFPVPNYTNGSGCGYPTNLKLKCKHSVPERHNLKRCEQSRISWRSACWMPPHIPKAWISERPRSDSRPRPIHY